MGFQLDIPDPYRSGQTIKQAYAWVNGLSALFNPSGGRLLIDFHPTEADSLASPPIIQRGIGLGEVISPGDPDAKPPVPPVVFITMAELMQIPEFAQGMSLIRGVLYQALAKLPEFAEATQV